MKPFIHTPQINITAPVINRKNSYTITQTVYSGVIHASYVVEIKPNTR